MKLYRCAWPNGSFSVVLAESKADAIFLLDEWGGADVSMISRLHAFMADFEIDRAAVTRARSERESCRREHDNECGECGHLGPDEAYSVVAFGEETREVMFDEGCDDPYDQLARVERHIAWRDKPGRRDAT